MTQVPQVVVGEPPPAHPPESTMVPPPPPATLPVVPDMRTSTHHPVVSDMRTSTHHPVLPESQMASETRTSTHHPVLPVVLPLNPPDDSVAPSPRVPPERIQHSALQSHLASPGLNTGNPGPNASMAGTPDPLVNSRAAYAALRALCLMRQQVKPSGTSTAHGFPVGQPTGQTIAAPMLHRRAPHLAGMSHRIRLPPPNPPIGTDNPPFANHSSVVELISTVAVMAVLVTTTINTVTPTLTSVAMAMSPSWGAPSFPPDTVTGPCMPAR
jgi:hypothetical protein